MTGRMLVWCILGCACLAWGAIALVMYLTSRKLATPSSTPPSAPPPPRLQTVVDSADVERLVRLLHTFGTTLATLGPHTRTQDDAELVRTLADILPTLVRRPVGNDAARDTARLDVLELGTQDNRKPKRAWTN